MPVLTISYSSNYNKLKVCIFYKYIYRYIHICIHTYMYE